MAHQFDGARDGNERFLDSRQDQETTFFHFSFMAFMWSMVFLIFSIPTAAWPADAGPENTPQPIHFSADRSLFDSKARQAVLEGRVKVVQSGNTIRADRMTIIFQESKSRQTETDPSSIKKIVAQGNVHIEFDRRIASGETAEYLAAERKLIISGPETKFIDGQDQISADKITYYRDDGRVEFTGSATQQVKGVMHTSEKGLN